MSTESSRFDDLLFLSAQLNQRAFVQPRPEEWLDAFLDVLCRRFPSIQSIQVVWAMKDTARQIGKAGDLPSQAVRQYSLEEPSPVTTTIRSGQRVISSGSLIYPISVAKDTSGALIIYTDAPTLLPDQTLHVLALQLGPAVAGAQTSSTQRVDDLQRLMNRLAVSLQGQKDVRQILSLGLHEVAELLGAQRAAIRLQAPIVKPDTHNRN